MTAHPPAPSRQDVDYIIVGAGAAGPVLAARLSQNPSVDVALLEAGPENTFEASRMQGTFFRLWGSEAAHMFQTTPQPELNGRQIRHPRGRMMGGSTAVNAGAWLRGVPADFDSWGDAGAAGWDAETAHRMYLQLEDTDRGPSVWRGAGGPIRLEDMPSPTPLADALLEGFVAAGLGQRGDPAGPTPYVADRVQTIFHDRVRRTPADAYLGETVRVRPNLSVLTNAAVERVVFEGTRAAGVVYRVGGTEHRLSARREVILCAGTIGTPQLLMLSGIGPGEHLRSLGIPVVADVPGVGEGFQDHVYAPMRALAPAGVDGAYPGRLDDDAIAQWLTDRTGPAAHLPNNGVAFAAVEPGRARPDVEFLFSYRPDLGDGTPFGKVADAEERCGYTIMTVLLHPLSRGTIRLASADPSEAPIIDPRYLSHPDDLGTLIRGLRAAARITGSGPLARYTEHVYPLADAGDGELADFVRAEATTIFHPVGTAKMGTLTDPLAVTDPLLRVRGVHGLRVADASVFPSLISGGPMAPTVLVAERAAELMTAGVTGG